MNYAELNSRITNLRCDLEELASEVNLLWVDAKGENLSTLLNELEDTLTEAANQIAEWEDSEELEEQWED